MDNPVIWRPTPERIQNAHVQSLMRRLGVSSRKALWEKSVSDISLFWKSVVEDLDLQWISPYKKVVDVSRGLPWAKWFIDGKINIADQCIDRHKATRPNHPALVWEGDDGSSRTLSYQEFSDQVSQCANALKGLGIQKGDTVGILMPMLPETVVQLFACFKVGAIAIPIFSGFGIEAIAARLKGSQARLLFTSDVVYRRGKAIEVKKTADAAVAEAPCVKHIVVVKRGDGKGAWAAGRDIWWNDFLTDQDTQCPSEPTDAEAKALILFTSGTTGKPKGAVHTHIGCLATIGKELRYSFNVDENSRFFWFTDIGWMMGPWEMIGVTLLGGTLFLFEGAPDYPTPARLWETIERHHLTHLGISPTLIRLLMRSGDEPLKGKDLSSLQFLGSTGEPWDPESYSWFFEKVGQKRCPILNISGGTEVIGCLLLPLPIDDLKACSLSGPGLGVDADVFDESGASVRGGIGHLVVKQPLPSMTKGFLNDDKRYLETYFSRFPNVWYHGDWAHVDGDGHWFLHGRSDDTIKVAGKRIGPVEYEAALLSDDRVSEVAAIGVPDSLKGEVCVCFAVLKPGVKVDDALRSELMQTAVNALGKSLAPKEIRFLTLLPKTRSAKIVRGLIRRLYLGEPAGDLSSVENLDSVNAVKSAR